MCPQKEREKALWKGTRGGHTHDVVTTTKSGLCEISLCFDDAAFVMANFKTWLRYITASSSSQKMENESR